MNLFETLLNISEKEKEKEAIKEEIYCLKQSKEFMSEDVKARVKRLIREFERKVTQIGILKVNTYNSLMNIKSTNERCVLMYHFMLNMTFEEIAETMHYSVRQILRIYKRAGEKAKMSNIAEEF